MPASGIEDLCSKRDELQKQILLEEEEKQRVQNDLRILTERLAQVNEGLAQKIAMRNDYDRTISETENAYKKVLTHTHTHNDTHIHACAHTSTHTHRFWIAHSHYYKYSRKSQHS